jgi:hypothetical protein
MWDKLLAMWSSFKTNVSYAASSALSYLSRIAAPVLSIGLVIGGILAAIEYKTLLLKLYSWLAKKDLNTAKQDDAALKKQEDDDKAQAAALINKADSEPPVDVDWYKKK